MLLPWNLSAVRFVSFISDLGNTLGSAFGVDENIALLCRALPVSWFFESFELYEMERYFSDSASGAKSIEASVPSALSLIWSGGSCSLR